MMTAFGIPSGMEIWIILVVALLLFGHRIPGMARSLGSGIVEFKKGLQGIEDDIDQASDKPSSPPKQIDQSPSEQSISSQDPHGAGVNVDADHVVGEKTEHKADA